MSQNALAEESSLQARAGILRPELLVLAAAFLWSSGGLGVKSIQQLPPVAIAGLRGSFAAMAMAIITVVTARARGERIVPMLRRPFVQAGALAYAATVVSFVLAARMTTATNAILIQYTGPVYVALLSWPLLGERPRRVDWIAIVGCLLGLLVCVGGELGARASGASAEQNARGLLFAVVSSFGFAALPLCLRLDSIRTAARGNPANTVAPLVSMTLGNCIAATTLFAAPDAVRAASLHDLGITLFLGVMQIAIPYVLYGMAVQRLSALKISLLAFVEPVLTPLWVFLGVHEVPGTSALLGGALILLSLSVQSAAKKRQIPAIQTTPEG